MDAIADYNEVVEEIRKSREHETAKKSANGTMSFSELKDLLSQNNEVFLDCDVVFSQGDECLKDGITFAGSDFSKDDEFHVVADNDLVIDGKGHSIDAKGLARIFIILNMDITITFRDISFKNA